MWDGYINSSTAALEKKIRQLLFLPVKTDTDIYKKTVDDTVHSPNRNERMWILKGC